MDAVSQCVDWIAYTAEFGTERLNEHGHPDVLNPKISKFACYDAHWLPDVPRMGYTSAFMAADKQGLKVYWNNDRREMGVHVSWSGSALQGENWEELANKITGVSWKITRLDLAVDVNRKWEIAALYEHQKQGWIVTNARKARLIQSTDGSTLYIGSRTSERYLRIYDKAAQTGTREPWTRIELECKGEFANGVFLYLLNETSPDFRDVIRGYVDFTESLQWQAAMASPTPPWSLSKAEKRTDTKAWLLQSVAPSLAKAIVEDQDFRDEWHARMLALLSGRVGEKDPFDGKADFDVE